MSRARARARRSRVATLTRPRRVATALWCVDVHEVAAGAKLAVFVGAEHGCKPFDHFVRAPAAHERLDTVAEREEPRKKLVWGVA